MKGRIQIASILSQEARQFFIQHLSDVETQEQYKRDAFLSLKELLKCSHSPARPRRRFRLIGNAAAVIQIDQVVAELKKPVGTYRSTLRVRSIIVEAFEDYVIDIASKNLKAQVA